MAEKTRDPASGSGIFYLMRTLKTRIVRSLKEYRKYLPEEAMPLDKMQSIRPETASIAEESEREKLEELHQHLAALPVRQ